MVKFEQSKRYLFVVDKDYYPLILKYKNNHPELNIKIIFRNALIDKAGYHYKSDPIPYLIKEKNIEYSKAKKYLNLIRVLRGKDDSPLSDLIASLKDYLDTDQYGLLELSRYQIYLLEMDEDEEIKSLLNRVNIPFNFLHLEDLELNRFENLNKINILHFSNKFSQFSYIFAEIRKKISEDEASKEHIKILVKDESDMFYVHTLGKLFGLDIYSVDQTPILSIPSIAKSVNDIYQNKNFSIDENDENLAPLSNLIKQYQLDEIEDFDFAYLNLVEILSNHNQIVQHGDRGIVVTNKYGLDPDDIYYVTNFEYGCFYKEYADNNVLSDNILRDNNLTTSFNKTAIDKRKKYNFLMYNNIEILSRVKQHLSDSIYDSHFLDDELKKRVINKKDKVEEFNINGLFTEEMKSLMTAHGYDQNYYYQEKDGYRSYNHQFSGVIANSLMVPDIWHVTSLERYYDCPFKFYMDTLIPLPSDLHHAYRGTFIHSLFEDIMHDDFDFDKSFERAKKAYINQMEKNNETFTPKEEMWLKMYYHWLKNIVPSLLRLKDVMNLVEQKNDAELSVNFNIDKYRFSGKIDKIIYTENNNEKYYTLVDYKTGSEKYDDMSLAVGKSIQLPLYFYALKEFKQKRDYVEDFKFGGFLIQHPYFKNVKEAFVDTHKFSEKTLLNKTRFSGVSLADEQYATSFDQTTVNSKGEFKISSGTFLASKLTFNSFDDDCTLLSRPPKGLEKFNLNDVLEMSKKAALRIIENIINNRFEIAPSSMDISKPIKDLSRLKCQYCNHRDICYVNKLEDAKDYSKYITNELLGKEEDSDGRQI